MVIRLGAAELHYDLHGDGEPLLWLHGALGHGADWRFIFDEPPVGYRLIAPDLRGHGRSTGAGATYSFRQTADDVLALLEHLHVDRVHIIGLSGGGITAMHCAMLAPARVTAMITVSAPPRFPEQARAMQRAYNEASLTPAEQAMMRERHARPGQLAALFAQINRMPDTNDPSFTADELARITADTLIVFGDRDPLYPVSLACELRQAILRSWLWVVPNGGHAPVFGTAARRFGETAAAFFTSRFAT